jgi:hypothetical protein
MGKNLVVSIVGVHIKLRFVEFFPNKTQKMWVSKREEE